MPDRSEGSDSRPQSDQAAEHFPATSKLLAGLGTFFVPLIALGVALVLRGSEVNTTRRQTLKRWAIYSASWLAVVALIVIVAAGSLLSTTVTNPTQRLVPGNTPCVGGPMLAVAGVPVGNGDYRFPCAGGGSTVTHLGG